MSWLREIRFASRLHVCDGCRREIDEEPYTVDKEPQGTAHKRYILNYKWCSDCRRVY